MRGDEGGGGDSSGKKEACPISLERIRKPYVHDGIVFEAHVMLEYARAVPNCKNPVTRAAVTDGDITALNLLVEPDEPLPIGRARSIASEEQLQRDEIVSYLCDEVRSVVSRTLCVWHSVEWTHLNFYASLGACVSILMRIRSDIVCAGGRADWDFLMCTMKKDRRCELAQELLQYLESIASYSDCEMPPYTLHSTLV
jgi:hypothetical protein